MFQQKLSNESLYKASIRGMHLRLQNLEQEDDLSQNAKVDSMKEGWEKSDEVLHYQDLL